MPLTLDDLRRFAVARSLFQPTTLERALDTLGFVQADPIRAPARAQDLTLRHRVEGYRAGDLERRYEALGIEEDFLVNYGFVTRAVYELMHPRGGPGSKSITRRKRVEALLSFVKAQGTAHPRQVDDHFDHGSVTNYWGGSSSATTHLLTDMHYRGLLRVVRRDAGIRVYGVREPVQPPSDRAGREARLDALVDVVVRKYAPLPAASLWNLVRRLRYAVPQWERGLASALKRAKQRLSHAHVDGIEWYWPDDETIEAGAAPDIVRLLAPFDPVVWDRRRFEILWGWAYRFEAYTPVKKRERGYYALPLLWRDRVVGWGNVAVKDGALTSDFGYVSGRRPRDLQFRPALDSEMEKLRAFLDVGSSSS
jgi:uncharacterized protein YcaQ